MIPDVGVVGLDLGVALGAHRRIAGRHRVVRRALEHVQVLGFAGDHRRRLDARRAGADQPDALARELDTFVRPLTSVVPVAPELVQTGDVRHVGRRQASHGAHDERRDHFVTAVRADRPAPAVLIEHRPLDARAEADVTPQVEPVGHVLEVREARVVRGDRLHPIHITATGGERPFRSRPAGALEARDKLWSVSRHRLGERRPSEC